MVDDHVLAGIPSLMWQFFRKMWDFEVEIQRVPRNSGARWSPITRRVKLGMGTSGKMTFMSNSHYSPATDDGIISCRTRGGNVTPLCHSHSPVSDRIIIRRTRGGSDIMVEVVYH